LKSKVSKAQEEVWEWKEACYQELKDIPPEERMQYIEREANEALEEAGLEKVLVRDGIYKIRRKPSGIVSEDNEDFVTDDI